MAVGNAPSISPKARSAVYIGCLAINVITVVYFGLAAIFGWLDVQQATAAGGVILAGINIISTGLAVGYRPTRPGAQVSP